MRTVLSGNGLEHRFVPAGQTAATSEAMSGPDDFTHLGTRLFVAFQNGVHAQGQPSPHGNRRGPRPCRAGVTPSDGGSPRCRSPAT